MCCGLIIPPPCIESYHLAAQSVNSKTMLDRSSRKLLKGNVAVFDRRQSQTAARVIPPPANFALRFRDVLAHVPNRGVALSIERDCRRETEFPCRNVIHNIPAIRKPLLALSRRARLSRLLRRAAVALFSRLLRRAASPALLVCLAFGCGFLRTLTAALLPRGLFAPSAHLLFKAKVECKAHRKRNILCRPFT